MTFTENTGKTIQQAFDLFHQKNPDVYEHFIRLALAAIRKNKKRISAKLIINVIRWEIFMRTEETTLFDNKGELIKFKINDGYTSRYARLFVRDYPMHADKIEMRELRS